MEQRVVRGGGNECDVWVGCFRDAVPQINGKSAHRRIWSDNVPYPVSRSECVVSACGNNTGSESYWYVFFILAFIDYPWVLLAKWKTGLWFNPSGIHIQIDALSHEIEESIFEIQSNFAIIFVVEFAVIIFAMLSDCGREIQSLRLVLVFVIVIDMLFHTCAEVYFYYVPTRVQYRAKIFSVIGFVRDRH